MRLLYYSPFIFGGLADYAHAQADALSGLGVEVTMLCSPDYERRNGNYRRTARLAPARKSSRLSRAATIMSNAAKLRHYIAAERFDRVLLASYSEYLAPIWSPAFRKLADAGVIFGANIHDPVRDFVVGPVWWHRWSVACGYSFLREAFVHEAIQLDTVRAMPALRTTVIPHGAYTFAPSSERREETRRRLGLPIDAKVMLSFGHIRDGKNLDLILRAMAACPSVYLVVAGKEQSSSQKPLSHYQELARSLDIDARCRWVHQYVPSDQVSALFSASDIVLLIYSKQFRSASGVLNVAVSYGTPCIASSGSGNLRTMVERYALGIWVEPDDLESLVDGVTKAVAEPPSPRWDAYRAENSWQRNAELVVDAFQQRGR